ncbi:MULTISPECIES: ISAs1 family transposase [Muribaculaceae]|uniref:ISAs1 family transposase n=1 Tax=Muribaculaceae TaxID=2005473 RepID=UPI00242B98F9|nr:MULTISPECIES: ISAs1 family transposase [Muribaculaceae]
MLITIFDGVKDPRKIDQCTYELGDLLAVAFLTYLSKREDYADMALFARHQARDFGLFPYTDKSPSCDTFERLFAVLKTEFMERAVIEQGKRIMDVLNEKQIAIDGKKQCGTAPKEKGPKGDYLLNAYVAENSLFIGQEKLQDKENEISAIPRLLDRLEIAGSIISIDAIGTQVGIADMIVGKGGHYFLAVKENQGALLSEIKDVIRYHKPFSTHSETEKGHARVETRTVSVFSAGLMEDKEILRRWRNLKTIVKVESHTVHVSDGGRETTQTRYYISDEDFPSAAYYGGLARGHWAVENGLHWHLDVTFREDDCRARKNNAAQNLSLLRKLVLQIAKATNDKLSLRKRLVRASMDKDYLRTLLNNYGF